MGRLLKDNRGDTLIEVLLATVVLSIIVASAYTLTGRASRINQNSAERSDAVAALQQQIEGIKLQNIAHLSDAPTTPWGVAIVWGDFVDNANIYTATNAPTTTNCRGFIEGTDTSPVVGHPNTQIYYVGGFSQVVDWEINDRGDTFNDTRNVGKYYIWFEPWKRADANYVDFIAHACWEGLGGLGPQESSLIYRLGTS